MKEQIEKILREQASNNRDQERELNSQKTKVGNQRELVMRRFGLGEIPSDVYETTIRSVNRQLEEIEIELTRIQKSPRTSPWT